MSELRQDITTKEWVILAPERGKRPQRHPKKKSRTTDEIPNWDSTCPFCPGNDPHDVCVRRARRQDVKPISPNSRSPKHHQQLPATREIEPSALTSRHHCDDSAPTNAQNSTRRRAQRLPLIGCQRSLPLRDAARRASDSHAAGRLRPPRSSKGASWRCCRSH